MSDPTDIAARPLTEVPLEEITWLEIYGDFCRRQRPETFYYQEHLLPALMQHVPSRMLPSQRAFREMLRAIRRMSPGGYSLQNMPVGTQTFWRRVREQYLQSGCSSFSEFCELHDVQRGRGNRLNLVSFNQWMQWLDKEDTTPESATAVNSGTRGKVTVVRLDAVGIAKKTRSGPRAHTPTTPPMTAACEVNVSYGAARMSFTSARPEQAVAEILKTLLREVRA